MKVIEIFRERIKTAYKIVISTHTHPDADGIGSQIALALALRYKGLDVVCVNEVPLLERYRYLDSQETVISYEEYMRTNPGVNEIDLFVIVDTNSQARIGGKMQKLLSFAKDVLYVDHHPFKGEDQDNHCVDTSMAATGQLVGKIIESLEIPFTKDLALPLYTAILIDTSSFRYPTVTGDTHRLIAKLMDTGISPPQAYNMIYGTKKISHMRLLGTILSSAQTTEDERIGWICLSEKSLRKHNVDEEDTHAFINHLLILDNIQVACMFREKGDIIKISMRASKDVDVGVLAKAIGGGGHNHSAAAVIHGKLNRKLVNGVIDTLKELLKKQL